MRQAIARAKKKRPFGRFSLELVAEWTGLEPATSGVTGQHSNRLNYHSAEPEIILICFGPRNTLNKIFVWVVGAEGIEPPTLSV